VKQKVVKNEDHGVVWWVEYECGHGDYYKKKREIGSIADCVGCDYPHIKTGPALKPALKSAA
jgi:hypothetical protein